MLLKKEMGGNGNRFEISDRKDEPNIFSLKQSVHSMANTQIEKGSESSYERHIQQGTTRNYFEFI